MRMKLGERTDLWGKVEQKEKPYARGASELRESKEISAIVYGTEGGTELGALRL